MEKEMEFKDARTISFVRWSKATVFSRPDPRLEANYYYHDEAASMLDPEGREDCSNERTSESSN